MDHKPAGPRQPPDKRNAAYESIFGRPGGMHHPSTLPPQTNYGQYQNPYVGNGSTSQQPPQRHPYQQQHYPPQPDRPTSYTDYGHPALNTSYPSPPQGLHRTPIQPNQPQYPHQNVQYPNQNNQQATLSPPQTINRARSMNSVPFSSQPVRQVQETDPSLERYTRAGLTPAQAYQQQVYMTGGHQPSTTNPNRRSYHSPHNSISGTSTHSQNGKLPDIPTVNFDLSTERDFGLNFNVDSASPLTATSSSELPWASAESPAEPTPQGSSASSVYSKTSANDCHAVPGSSRPYPLQLDTAMTSAQAAGNYHSSPATSVVLDPQSSTSSRQSTESARTLPPVQHRRERTAQDRSRSMSSVVHPAHIPSVRGQPPIPPLPNGRNSPRMSTGNQITPRRSPIVYPALLSRVAEAFRNRVQLSDQVKDGLTYKDVFDGREAVDKIAYIIKTTDRNLALLLGRALDAQKFFHAVTYDHRLRDNANDLYQFRTVVASPFSSGELEEEEGTIRSTAAPLLNQGSEHASIAVLTAQSSPTPSGESDSGFGDLIDGCTRTPSPSQFTQSDTRRANANVATDDAPLPTGVFTLLTDCYSPTCSRDRLCYSIACPRRLEQQSRLNMKPQPGLKKQISKESLGELVTTEPGTLWIHSVPQEIVNSVSEKEKRRQEAINEVIYTERDFVRDMEYLRDIWIKPLKESEILPAERRTDFLEQVFWNVHDIIAVNTRLRDALSKRQKSYAVVEQIGDIFLDSIPHFSPFVSYGAHQLYGKYEFEKEKSSNPAFSAFVEEAERRPESRKLELNGYLTKPTTRLARYPLLLEAVLKQTPDDSPDKVALPKAVTMVREFLKAVNSESGKTENRFNLLQLDQALVFKPGEQVDLRLKEEGREMIYKGTLNKRGGGVQGDSGDLMVFLFDHALLMVKPKTKVEQYKVHRRPIPLELLLISAPDDYAGRPSNRQRQLLRNLPAQPPPRDPKGGFSITMVHLGRKFYQITLWASTYVSQRKWVEVITKQQEMMKQRSTVFDTISISEGFFVGANRVNCAAPFYGGRKVVYGTDDGIYLSDFRERNRDPVKVLGLREVLQVDVLEDYQLLVVLSERQVITFPLDALDHMDPLAGLKRAKRIASHITFFKTGICLGRALVCVVKASPLSSTIKTLEPIDQNIRGRNRPTFRKLLQGGNDTLRVFKEFYIPLQSSSIHFLKTKLCVGCPNGFEIVDLETLDTQGLLDPADESLDFVRRRESTLKPMAIYRIENEFLLCYDEFAFYVNKTGWRSRRDFMVYWEGSPTGFALHYPYVLAFEPTFVEIRHVETGSMAQIIQGNNLRLLFADTPPSTMNGSSNAGGYSPYQQTQYGYNPYAAPPPPYGRPSLGSMQNHNGPPYTPHPNQNHRPGPILRDEILLASDDRVMRVELVTQQSELGYQ